MFSQTMKNDFLAYRMVMKKTMTNKQTRVDLTINDILEFIFQLIALKKEKQITIDLKIRLS